MEIAVDPVLAEQQANAAEVRRLAAQEERRRQNAGNRASGFALRRWRLAGINGQDAVDAVTTVLQAVLESPDTAAPHLVLHRAAAAKALGGEPDDALVPALPQLLRTCVPEDVLRHLRALREAGIEWLTPEAGVRLGILCSTAPDRRLAHTPHPGGAGSAYELFVSLVTRRTSRGLRGHIPSLIPTLSPAALDTLIDSGAVTHSDRPWDLRPSDEAAYLRARTAPELLTEAEAEELGWLAYERRTAFRSGWVLPVDESTDDYSPDLYDYLEQLTAGETHHLNDLDQLLPDAQRVALRDLRSYCTLGSWPPHLLADRGLWLLMEALWRPGGVIHGRLSEFHAWAGLRSARALISMGDVETAQAQLTRLLQVGAATPQYRAEVENLNAYLAFCNDRLPEAERILTRALELYASEGSLLPERAEAGRHRLESNLMVVERRRATKKNDRVPAANPFLELGVPHGTLSWEDLYRELTAEAVERRDTEERARLNDIRTRIESVLRNGETEAGVFFVPHDESPYQDPDERSDLLVPPLAPLERRTAELTTEEMEDIRADAAVELLDGFLTSPPRVHRQRT
ncbi:hypothetical protein [Kitasatospora cineracea]|uniref:hypothetical protein n=1 Tax=Kitasatospora cineracea TaxID=88074 RepID=UPI0037B07851